MFQIVRWVVTFICLLLMDKYTLSRYEIEFNKWDHILWIAPILLWIGK